MDNHSLAVIDSGLGGLSILQSLKKEIPKESFIYLADHQFFPYGDKTRKQINRRLLTIINYLTSLNVKAIVIACNTITTSSIKLLRNLYPHVPFIGTEPAIKPAIKKNLKENIVALTTESTAKSNSFKNLIKNFDNKGQVITCPCPGLVEVIESASKSKIKKELTMHIRQIKVNFSAVVLGCTHYILVKELIRKVVKPHVLIIEPSQAIARQTRKVLEVENLLSTTPTQNKTCQFLTTGDSKSASKSATLLLKQSIIFNKCNI